MTSGCDFLGSVLVPDSQIAQIVCASWGDLPYSEQITAFAIMIAESGGYADAWNQCGEDSRGLAQINVGPGANTQYASLDLFNPTINSQVARLIYNAAAGFTPWSTFNNGDYEQYLGRAIAAIGQGGCNPSGTTTLPAQTCPPGMSPDPTNAGQCDCSDPSQTYDDVLGYCTPITPVNPSTPGTVTNLQTGTVSPTPATAAVSGGVEVSGQLSTGALLLLALGGAVVVYGVTQARRP